MKSYFYYAPSLIIPRTISAIIIIVFARILTPTEVGLYSLVIIFGEYLDTVFVRWIRAGYTRLHFSYQKRGQALERFVLVLMIPGILLSILLAFGYAMFDADLGPKWAALLSLYVVANFILYQGLQFLRVRGQRRAYVTIESGRSILGFGLALALTHWIAPDYGLLLIGTQGLTLVAAAWLLWRMLDEDRASKLDRALLQELTKYALPLLASFFLAGTTLVLDRVLLAKIAGPAMLGVYAVSYQLARPAIDILFNIINVGGFPKLVAAYEAEGDSGAQRVLYQKNVAIMLVTLPMLIFILVSAEQISALLLRDEYAAVAPTVLRLVAVAAFLRGWTRFLVDQIFLLRKTTSDPIWNLIPSILALIASATILIPMMGVYGAALSAVIGAAVEAVFAVRRAKRRMQFRAFGAEVAVIGAACLAGGGGIFLGFWGFGLAGWVVASFLALIGYGLVTKKYGIFRVLEG
ncbi:MAG: lipopolysaccharide biosynthesis protein [Rhodobacteraceae bacterium]|nr:lipopolysaccharide biosynthesis protein [Paracoccaceae bacterium]